MKHKVKVFQDTIGLRPDPKKLAELYSIYSILLHLFLNKLNLPCLAAWVTWMTNDFSNMYTENLKYRFMVNHTTGGESANKKRKYN